MEDNSEVVPANGKAGLSRSIEAAVEINES